MARKSRLEKLFVVIWAISLGVHVNFVRSHSKMTQIIAFVPITVQPKSMIKGGRDISNSRGTKQIQQQPAFFRSSGIYALRLSKKKAAPASVKKIQVKMLKYVEGTGHIGEIVMVTPAFFQNKLRPSASAVMITDEEVMKEKKEAEKLEKETREKAEMLKERIADLSIVIPRKSGPDGHLFGGIGPKTIMEELEKSIDDNFLKQKSVKITSIVNEDGSELIGDIKHTGMYQASLSLTKDISGMFRIIVEAER
jgi:ribosomal protein L9